MGVCGSCSRGQAEPSSRYRSGGAAAGGPCHTVQVAPTCASHEGDDVDAARVLLLGGGEAGKSTLFKQLQALHGAGYSDADRAAYRGAILAGTLQAMKTLVQQSAALHTPAAPTRYSDTLANDAAAVLACPLPSQAPPTSADGTPTGEPPPAPPLTPALARSIGRLWADAGIRATFAMRSRFQCPDEVAYFFDRVETLGSPSYVPTFSDLLHVRARTVGIVQGCVAVPLPTTVTPPPQAPSQAPGAPAPALQLCLVDVGGQRPERRHWFHALDHVACVVFVASVADFDLALAEDRRRSNAPTLSASASSSCAAGTGPGPGAARTGGLDGDSAVTAAPASPCDDDPWLTNRMQDSLTLFTEVCSSHFFRHTDILLLLNKSDLLSTKMSRGGGGGDALSAAFPEYAGGDDAAAALNFIRRQFEAHQVSIESRRISTRVVCAKDAESVRGAFACVAESVAAHAARVTPAP